MSIVRTLARTLRALPVCLGITCVFALPACGISADDLAATRDRAAALERTLATNADTLRAAADGLPSTDPALAALARQAADAQAARDLLARAVTQADAVLTEAANPTDGLTTAATAASALVPEPYRLPLVLTGALAATVLRSIQLKRAGASIAKSIDTAMRDDPELRHRLRSKAETLRGIQTPTARRIVDETTKPAPMLRLPV